jgi:hypothetical protein
MAGKDTWFRSSTAGGNLQKKPKRLSLQLSVGISGEKILTQTHTHTPHVVRMIGKSIRSKQLKTNL